MLGAVELGAWELGAVDIESAEEAIVLRPQDASLLIVRPRETLYALTARHTLYRLQSRRTTDDRGPT